MSRAIVDYRDYDGAQRTGYLLKRHATFIEVEMADGQMHLVSNDKIIKVTGGENDQN